MSNTVRSVNKPEAPPTSNAVLDMAREVNQLAAPSFYTEKHFVISQNQDAYRAAIRPWKRHKHILNGDLCLSPWK